MVNASLSFSMFEGSGFKGSELKQVLYLSNWFNLLNQSINRTNRTHQTN